MAHTTVLLTDHLGSDKPKVYGNEYVVDAVINISSLTSGGEVIQASELGLSTLSCVIVTGAQNPNHYLIQPVITLTTGAYESSSSVKLHYADDLGNNSTTSDTAVGSVRIRAFGNL
tara:strand:+ start:1362 stop:1709 length:348 start_codon:yes stop_codon:yes gene_type:complete